MSLKFILYIQIQIKTMPGLIFSTYSSDKNQAGIQSLYRNPRYTHRTYLNQNNCFIASHTHDLYPFQELDTVQFHVVFEGMIYNAETDSVLGQIIDLLASEELDEIAALIKSLDGEFCIIFREKSTGKITILNDHFGRLPLYMKKTNDGIAISREIQFILNVVDAEEMNKLSIAHQLLFGYTLGEHTLWEDIKRIQPNSILQVTPNHPRLVYKNYFELPKTKGEGSVRQLADSFENALTNRLDKFPNSVLSLSGGLDSRLIAGACNHLNIDIICATYSSEGKTNDLDVKVAREITHTLEFSKHYVFETAAKPNSSTELLQCKAGLNYLGMDFILPFHEWHNQNNFVSITGDGGDKFFVDLEPHQQIKSARQFLQLLLRKNGNTTVQAVSKLTGLSIKEIEESILSHVTGYPGENWNERYAAFLIRERGVNWLFEGEDRCRYFTWLTSPYYAPDVIKESLKFSQIEKRYGGIFVRLFDNYKGKLASFINPNWQCAPNELRKVKLLFLKQKVKSIIGYRKQEDFSIENFKYERDLKHLLKSSEIFDYSVIDKKYCTEECIWNVYTILRVEDLQNNNAGSRIVAL